MRRPPHGGGGGAGKRPGGGGLPGLAGLLKRGLILPVEGPKELCAKLVDLLKDRLGPRAEPFIRKLQGCETRESLEEEALRVALKVKLTLDKRAGEELEKAVKALFR